MKNTVAQQEAMKNDFTFGVEVEMNGITRREAATIAAKFFGTGNAENTASRNGYMTWSAFDKQTREWKFSRDTSIRAENDDEKCELITPILEYKDIPQFLDLLNELKKAGAVSNPTVGAGVHIHVGRKDGFKVAHLKNLVNIMAAHEEQIGRAIRIAESRTERYCKVIEPKFLEMMHKTDPQTMKQLEKCWYAGNDAEFHISHHYNQSRYHMFNLHSFFHGHGTVEFRLFQFSDARGILRSEMLAYIQLCLGMCALACSLKRASSKPQQTENEKYAFRCWMLRLGFIGDEFETARSVLLQNLDGNGAWRMAS